MAEILRDDQLNERREKARNVDMKLHDAKLRRMFLEAQAVAVRKERLVYVCLPFTELQLNLLNQPTVEEFHLPCIRDPV